jgi:hypothetical protein
MSRHSSSCNPLYKDQKQRKTPGEKNMNDIPNRFNHMKIGTKILIICLILVIVPTLVIGTVAIVIEDVKKEINNFK